MKTLAKTILLSTVFALALAAPASAHHVDAAASSADCTKVTAKYVGFNDNDKPVSEKITVDGTTVYTKSGYTWSGSDNSHAISYPSALSAGNHTIVFTATWSTQSSNNATFTKQVSCEGSSTGKVNSSTSAADCTKVTARYESFDDDDKPVSEKITVDGTTVYTKSGYTWSGSSNTHAISYPSTLKPGNHTVVFTATWATQGNNNGSFTKQVTCVSPSKVNTAASSADCEKVTAGYESFGDDDKPVSEKITLDGTTIYNKGGYTWSGSSSTHTIRYPAELAPGDHTIVFTATWSTQGSNASSFTVRVHCEAPPARHGQHLQPADRRKAAQCPHRPQVPLDQDGRGQAVRRRRGADPAHRPVRPEPQVCKPAPWMSMAGGVKHELGAAFAVRARDREYSPTGRIAEACRACVT
jgi:hypothetical protein